MKFFLLFISFFFILLSIFISIFLNIDNDDIHFQKNPGVSSGFLIQTNKSLDRIPYVIGYKGTSTIDPENTMMSHTKSISKGADILHTNIQRNKNNKLFLFHDKTIERYTSDNLLKEKYYFNNLTTEDVLQLDAGYSYKANNIFPFRGKGLKVPSLYEWLLRFQKYPMLIEIQEDSDLITDLLINELLEYLNAIEQQGRELPPALHSRLVIFSKYTKPLQRYRFRTQNRFPSSCGEDESIYLYYLYKTKRYTAPLSHLIGVDIIPNCQCLIIPQSIGNYINFNDKEFINFIHSLHMDIIFKVINHPTTIKNLYSIGADGIITDRSDIASKILVDLNIKSNEQLYKQTSQILHDIIQYEQDEEENTQQNYKCVSILCILTKDINPILIFFALILGTISILPIIVISIYICYKIFKNKNQTKHHTLDKNKLSNNKKTNNKNISKSNNSSKENNKNLKNNNNRIRKKGK